MSKFMIEADVAVTPIQRNSRGSKYPFTELGIGGYNEAGQWVGPSFFVPGDKAANTLRNTATRLSKQGYKFSIRSAEGPERDEDGNVVLDENGNVKMVVGARVWRVA